MTSREAYMTEIELGNKHTAREIDNVIQLLYDRKSTLYRRNETSSSST